MKLEGVGYSSSTARYVYYAFVAPFDLENKDLMVVYRDHDGRNISYKNLLLSTRRESAHRSIQLKRTHPYFFNQRIPIMQLSMDGKIIASFASITEAAKKIGMSVPGIHACVSGRIYQFHGFRWQSNLKTANPPAAKAEPTVIFNEYLWKKIGRPKDSRKNSIPVLILSPESLVGECWKPVEGMECCPW